MTQHALKAIAFRGAERVSSALKGTARGAAYVAGGTLASVVFVLSGLTIIAI